ncbi:MAG: 30S ribosome-binding factor RbfA [bacterium]|nr:30S ribosome-binding factor RbfA [bacterium]
MASERTVARLQSQILRRAAHCLQFELSDPRASFITVTRVELSPDVTSGKIYWSTLDDDRTKAEHLLDHASGYIQRQIASVLRTRTVPHLRWVFDESIAEAARLDRLIADARERDLEINPHADEEPPQDSTE